MCSLPLAILCFYRYYLRHSITFIAGLHSLHLYRIRRFKKKSFNESEWEIISIFIFTSHRRRIQSCALWSMPGFVCWRLAYTTDNNNVFHLSSIELNNFSQQKTHKGRMDCANRHSHLVNTTQLGALGNLTLGQRRQDKDEAAERHQQKLDLDNCFSLFQLLREV